MGHYNVQVVTAGDICDFDDLVNDNCAKYDITGRIVEDGTSIIGCELGENVVLAVTKICHSLMTIKKNQQWE